MTHKEWITLSELEQRIAVAVLSKKYHANLREALPDKVTSTHGMEILDHANVPDYTYDLNAMQSVEQTLPGSLAWDVYHEKLIDVIGSTDWVTLWNATAAHRAEAFVLTMDPE